MKTNTEHGDRGGRLFASGSVPSTLPVEGQDSHASWWETPYGLWRRAVEVEAMKRFPNFRLHDHARELRWEGWLQSSLGVERPDVKEGLSHLAAGRYDVTIVYPSDFPDIAPIATIRNYTFLPLTPHLLAGNRPCLFLPEHGSRSGYDPARTTAATIVSWTSLWIHAYETWLATGNWPGRER